METFAGRWAVLGPATVVSLPMRDGNCARPVLEVDVIIVVSLPMRDGNFQTQSVRGGTEHVVSLPMRDGNEDHRHGMGEYFPLLAYL